MNSSAEFDAAAAAQMDQVRDILFGTQFREIHERCGRIETRLQDELNSLRDELGRKTEALSETITAEIRSLSEQIRAEQQQRYSEQHELSQQMQQNASSLDERLNGLAGTISAAEHTLRKQTIDQINNLRNDVQQQQEALRREMDREIGQLSVSSVERTALSDALRELSERFGDGQHNEAEASRGLTL